MTNRSDNIRNMVLSALFLAVAYVLPYFTGNIPQIGSMLLPMHLPTILCGFLCGAPWGAAVGFFAPLMRSAILGMPYMYPTAIAMAFEMAVYGFVSGFLYHRLSKSIQNVYIALISSMLCGRIVWGIVMSSLLVGNGGFTVAAFIAGAFTNAIPGIILQLVAIPAIVLSLRKANLVSRAV